MKLKETFFYSTINDFENFQKNLKFDNEGDFENLLMWSKSVFVEILNRNEIDVILLDIVMPEMNGFEVLKYIKTDKRFFEIPVIMISSMDDTDSIYRCIENGADDYITKPFDKSILDARISSCIEKKHLRDKEKSLMKELEEEQQKSENLLLNILPDDIAQRLKAGETTIATKHEQVSILFR